MDTRIDAGRMRYEGQPVTVSHETIYAYVYSDERRAKTLAKLLPLRRKQRKVRHAKRSRGLVFPPDRAMNCTLFP